MVKIAIILLVDMLIWCSIKNKGLPDCISRCYYIIGDFFVVIMVCIAAMMMVDTLDKRDNIFTFLMCAGIAFVAASPKYLDAQDKPMHFAAAVVSASCSLPFVLSVQPAHIGWAFAIAALGLFDRQHWLLWAELGCFASVFACLL